MRAFEVKYVAENPRDIIGLLEGPHGLSDFFPHRRRSDFAVPTTFRRAPENSLVLSNSDCSKGLLARRKVVAQVRWRAGREATKFILGHGRANVVLFGLARVCMTRRVYRGAPRVWGFLR